jgi:RNA polymerase sigma-70 factor (ECF subfamily)
VTAPIDGQQAPGYGLFPGGPGRTTQPAGQQPGITRGLDRAIELAGNTAETAYLTRRRDQLG